MKRNELPELLFKKIKDVGPYPDKVEPVKEMLDITAFFPGGRGLWLEENYNEFPDILVLGQDFSTINAYENMVKDLVADLNSPTWRNLIKLFEEADIDLNKCFFSNVFMGLRDTEKMTGKFPGFKNKDFVNRNLDFLSYQIDIIKPKVIVTLGIHASEMLSKLSKPDLDCWEKGKALRNPNEGYKSNIRFKNHSCICVALEHTSLRHLNVKRRVYGDYEGHDAEVKMLREAII